MCTNISGGNNIKNIAKQNFSKLITYIFLIESNHNVNRVMTKLTIT